MSTTAIAQLYPDPLRKGGQQACLWVQLVCATCGLDLSGSRADGLIDLKTAKCYCGRNCLP